MKTRFLPPLTLLAAVAVVGGQASAQAPAQAAPAQPAVGAPPADTAGSPDINLSPRRVVIGEGRRTSDEILVFNRSNTTATYSIDLIDRVMGPDGVLKNLEEAAPEEKARLKSAKAFLRYSPRRVTLKPGEAQTVRVQARRPSDLPPGEYRTHFTVAAVPPETTGLDIAEAATAANASEIRIRLVPVFGISIPIIVRQGELAAEAGVAAVTAATRGERSMFDIELTRKGQRSVYGDVDVFLLGQGAPKRVAQVNGVGVYPELERRTISAPLLEGAARPPAGSRIRVVYTDAEFKKGAVLAERELILP